MHPKRVVAVGVLWIATVHAALLLLEVSPARNGGAWDTFWDPDCYTRLMRVQQLHELGGWYDPVMRRINAPYGLALHWTRPVDLLLLLGAWLGSLFTDFRSALHGWGMLFGPFLHALCVPILSYGTRPFLSGRAFLLAVFLFGMQRGISYDFLVGVVDHHGPRQVLLLAVLALLLRHMSEPPAERRRLPLLPFAAGCAGGLMVWTTAEGMVALLGLFSALALLWVWQGGERLRELTAFAFGVAGMAVVAVLLERPPADWLSVEFDRISVGHAAVFLAALLSCGALWLLARRGLGRTPLHRLGLGLGAAAASALALAAGLPGLFAHPYAALDPLVREALIEVIPADQRFLPTSPMLAFNFALEVIPALWGAAFAVFWWVRKPGARPRQLFFLVCLAVFAAYAVLAYRGLPMLALVAVLPWTEAVAHLAERVRLQLRGFRPAAAAGAATALVLVSAGHWLTAGAIVWLRLGGLELKNLPSCRYGDVAPFVPPPRHGETLLTDVFASPEVAYRTGYAALGGPYHRNASGVRDSYRLFAAPDGPEASSLARDRRLRAVLLCKTLSPGLFAYLRRNRDGLGARLLDGRPPVWLRRVELPPSLSSRFALYEVTLER
ncbi:MAG: hypothetical protein HYZ28_05160 [Myxococcales bacterium]|nr:hypothetical protein [Myxococcales bacterium]